MSPIRLLSNKTCAALAIACLAGGAQAAAKDYVYIGTYTSGTASQGIYLWQFDATTGKAKARGLAAATGDPSFLELRPDGKSLYAVNENASVVSAFAIAPADGKLALLGEQPSRGSGPAYVGVDRSGKLALVANYGSGSVALYPLADNGNLEVSTGFAQDTGSSVQPNQTGPHAHAIVAAPDNRFALVADLGADKIYSYKLDAAAGTLDATGAPVLQTSAGAGPRHLVFSADGRFVYAIDEITSSVAVHAYDAATGVLTPLQTVSTLPAGFTGANTGAEIALHPNGKFLYASNRGQDAIAVLAVDAATGRLTLSETVSTRGHQPRSFALDPSGAYLFAANQASNSVVIFAVNAKTGHLKPTGRKLTVAAPVCVKFLPQPAQR